MSCSSETVKKMLDVTFCLCFWSLFGVFGVETDVSVSVMEGDSVTLKIDDTQILRDDEIMWRFGPQQIEIAEINRNASKIKLKEDADDGRFRGRIELDNQTGSLIITNIRTTDSGQYNVKTTRTQSPLKIFTLTVYARLPVPVIIRDSSQCSSSSKCVLVCSVVNVTQATLSWYKGNSLFSSISVSDLNSLSLPLEVEYQENNIYSCVINNPIRNQTKHLNITEVCQTCSDNKGVPQIVLISAAAAGTLLFVLIIAVVIFCICRKCRKTDQEVQTREEEITYADPAFYKRKATKSKVKEEDDVVYAGVAVRR